MPDEEVRVTSETGGQKGKKLARFDLLPVEPLTEVARLYGRGAEKYADRNWERGYDWSLSFAAMQRHAWAFWGGESIDPETERHHLASVVFHAMALMEYEGRGKGTDDRPTTNQPQLKEGRDLIARGMAVANTINGISLHAAICPLCQEERDAQPAGCCSIAFRDTGEPFCDYHRPT